MLPPDQAAVRYAECWGAFNARDFGKLSDCYAPRATAEMMDSGMPRFMGPDIVERWVKPITVAFPDTSGEIQLELVMGKTIASIVLVRGKHTGPLMGPGGEIAATDRQIGFLIGHVVELEGNKVVAHREYSDQGTMLGQLRVTKGLVRKVMKEGQGMEPASFQTGSELEKANEAAYRQAVAAFKARDEAGLKALMADDVVVSAAYRPGDDRGIKKAIAFHKEAWQGFSDVKVEHEAIGAVGPYVVAMGRFTGTNDGVLPSLNLWKPTGQKVNLAMLEFVRFEGGKMKKHWLFANGLAFAAQLGLGGK